MPFGLIEPAAAAALPGSLPTSRAHHDIVRGAKDAIRAGVDQQVTALGRVCRSGAELAREIVHHPRLGEVQVSTSDDSLAGRRLKFDSPRPISPGTNVSVFFVVVLSWNPPSSAMKRSSDCV